MNCLWFSGWGVNPNWLAEQLSSLKLPREIKTWVAPAQPNLQWVESIKSQVTHRWWCGWSMGGLRALETALKDPACEGVMILAGTPCFRRQSDWALGIDAMELASLIERMACDPEKSLKRFYRLIGSGEKQSKTILQSLMKNAYQWANDQVLMLQEELLYLSNTDLRQTLKQIKKPIYFILGQHDPLLPSKAVFQLQELTPWVKVIVVPEVGHTPFFDPSKELLEWALRECYLWAKKGEDENVKTSFNNAGDYTSVSSIQRASGLALIEQAPSAFVKAGDRLLDLGCGTGFMVRRLLDRFDQKLAWVGGMDASPDMLKLARQSQKDHREVYFPGALEQPEGGLSELLAPWDGLVSNFAWHWLPDPLNGIFEWLTLLKSGGWMGIAMPVEGSLEALQQAWSTIDGYQHTIRFPCGQQLLEQLGSSKEISALNHHFGSFYTEHDSLKSLRDALRQLGAPQLISGGRRGLMTARQMQKVQANLADFKTSRGRLPLNYQVMFIWCQKK